MQHSLSPANQSSLNAQQTVSQLLLQEVLSQGPQHPTVAYMLNMHLVQCLTEE